MNTTARILTLIIGYLAIMQAARAGEEATGQVGDPVLVGESVCGRLDAGSLGPFDYRDRANSTMLKTVNGNHFNADVQQLVKGQTSVEVLADLDFILRHFPNHQGALRVMARYFLEGGRQMRFLSAECYFDRALRGYPDDTSVRQIFSMYLTRKGRYPQAIEQLEEAIKLNLGSSMELHYNLGLLYADLKDYDRANEQAAIAYGLGHPLPGLRDKLVRAGQWRSQAAIEKAQAAQP